MPKYYEDKEEDYRACAGIREDFKACLLQHDCVVKVGDMTLFYLTWLTNAGLAALVDHCSCKLIMY